MAQTACVILNESDQGTARRHRRQPFPAAEAHSVHPQAAAAPDQDLQTINRFRFRRQARPCCRHALMLSIDEKSQLQALDRTQPSLPLRRGKCTTMTHDYKRNGTTTLFAALSVLEGKVIGRCGPRQLAAGTPSRSFGPLPQRRSKLNSGCTIRPSQCTRSGNKRLSCER